jgi:hypothetical protein
LTSTTIEGVRRAPRRGSSSRASSSSSSSYSVEGFFPREDDLRHNVCASKQDFLSLALRAHASLSTASTLSRRSPRPWASSPSWPSSPPWGARRQGPCLTVSTPRPGPSRAFAEKKKGLFPARLALRPAVGAAVESGEESGGRGESARLGRVPASTTSRPACGGHESGEASSRGVGREDDGWRRGLRDSEGGRSRPDVGRVPASTTKPAGLGADTSQAQAEAAEASVHCAAFRSNGPAVPPFACDAGGQRRLRPRAVAAAGARRPTPADSRYWGRSKSPFCLSKVCSRLKAPPGDLLAGSVG